MAITGALFGVTQEITRPDSKAKTEYVEPFVAIELKKVQRERVLSRRPDIFDELYGKKIPSFRYLLHVAICESHQNWKDKGSYSGGYGIMHHKHLAKLHSDYVAENSTWWQWGGWEFGKYPYNATSKEQTLVWIRTYVTGYVRPNGVFRPPAAKMPNSTCHDDMKVGWRVYKGQKWPIPDDWKPGDTPVTPWRND